MAHIAVSHLPGVSKLSPLINQPPFVLGQNNCGLCCPSHDRLKNAGAALMFGSVVPLSVPVPGLLLSSEPPHAAKNAAVPTTTKTARIERAVFKKAIVPFPCAED